MSEPAFTPIDFARLTVETIGEDIKHVHVRATVSAAIAAIFVTQIELAHLRGLDTWYERLLVAAIVCLFGAAVCYFGYTQLLNRTRLKVVAGLPDLARRAGEEKVEMLSAISEPWTGTFMRDAASFSRPLWLYHAGQGLFVAGVSASFVVVARLLTIA